ncbi:MAG: S41 family peptidase [Clostridiales bacterium]|nr:S41 family peptidase [Clostridiales bacterium]
MKKWGQSLLALLLALALSFSPAAAFAAELSAEQGGSNELTEEEKAVVAGELLAGIIDLVNSKYVGDEVNTEMLYEAAVRGMTLILDPYTQYFNEEELARLEQSLSSSMYGIGVRVEMNSASKPEIIYVMPGTPAEKSGLIAGDIIESINSKSVEGLKLDDVILLIGDSSTQSVEISFSRGSSKRSLSIKKEAIKIDTVTDEAFEDLIEGAASNSQARYVRITEFAEDTAKEFKQMITRLQEEGVKRIALDLRGNPGGYADVAVEICNLIVPQGPIMYTIDKNGNRSVISSKLETVPFEKIIVLTDSGTASAAEVLASALQDSKAAVLVGGVTYGKGVIQSLYQMPLGGALKLTTERYLRRSGEELDKIGITPDILVDMPQIVTQVKLDENNSSPDIPLVREILSYLSYDVPIIDNKNLYDEKLKAAVVKFQEASQLPASGTLDDITLYEMDIAVYRNYYKSDLALSKAYELLK